MNLRHQARAPTAPKEGKRSVEPRIYVRPLPQERAKLEAAAAMVGAGGIAPFLLQAGLAQAESILTGEASPVALRELAADLERSASAAEALFFDLRHASLRLAGVDAPEIAEALADEGETPPIAA